MKVWTIGGTSGIGLAVHKRLLADGIHASLATGENEVDVRSQFALDQFAESHSPIDAVVYSAGINYLDWSDSIDLGRSRDLYDVNVLGLLRALRAVQTAVRCVVIGSDAAWRPMRTSAAYCGSKAALDMTVKVIARERAAEGFVINTIAPGKVAETGMTEYTDLRSAELRPDMDHIEYQAGQIPSGEFLTADDVAEVVVSTLTATPHLNGATIPVTGGRY